MVLLEVSFQQMCSDIWWYLIWPTIATLDWATTPPRLSHQDHHHPRPSTTTTLDWATTTLDWAPTTLDWATITTLDWATTTTPTTLEWAPRSFSLSLYDIIPELFFPPCCSVTRPQASVSATHPSMRSTKVSGTSSRPLWQQSARTYPAGMTYHWR